MMKKERMKINRDEFEIEAKKILSRLDEPTLRKIKMKCIKNGAKRLYFLNVEKMNDHVKNNVKTLYEMAKRRERQYRRVLKPVEIKIINGKKYKVAQEW